MYIPWDSDCKKKRVKGKNHKGIKRNETGIDDFKGGKNHGKCRNGTIEGRNENDDGERVRPQI
jgi:hypothetical protein